MADDRDQELIKIAMYKESLDTVRVHNILNHDFIVQNDKSRSNEKWIVPAETKDIGKGKGNADVPRYIAERFRKMVIVEWINEESSRLWDKEKTKYRLDERPMYEEKLGLRTDNQKIWDELSPKIILGIVSRYGGADLPDPEEQVIEPRTGNMLQDSAERLHLYDKLIDQNKEELANAITE